MAYFAEVLEAKIQRLFKEIPMAEDVVLSSKLEYVVDDDGNTALKPVEVRGDQYLDDKLATVIAKVISQAVTEFLIEES